MTYRELYEKATRKLEKSEITLGEYEKITKALDREVVGCCKDCEYWDRENDGEHGICDIFTKRDLRYTPKTFYCGSFEKRGDSDDSN